MTISVCVGVATLMPLGICCTTGCPRDRKSTRLNSSHSQISYAVFCLKKKKKTTCRNLDQQGIYKLLAHPSRFSGHDSLLATSNARRIRARHLVRPLHLVAHPVHEVLA